MTITDVEFLDKFGLKGLRVNSMDPLTVRIHYYALEDVSDITFGIAIHTEDGRHIFGTNTKIKKTP